MHVLAQPLLFAPTASSPDTGILTFEDLGAGPGFSAVPGAYLNSLGLTFSNATCTADNPSETDPVPSSFTSVWNIFGFDLTIDVNPAMGYRNFSFWRASAAEGVTIRVTDSLAAQATLVILPAGGAWIWIDQGTFTLGGTGFPTLSGTIAKIEFLSVAFIGIDNLRLWA